MQQPDLISTARPFEQDGFEDQDVLQLLRLRESMGFNVDSEQVKQHDRLRAIMAVAQKIKAEESRALISEKREKVEERLKNHAVEERESENTFLLGDHSGAASSSLAREPAKEEDVDWVLAQARLLSLAPQRCCIASSMSRGAIFAGPDDAIGGSTPATVPQPAKEEDAAWVLAQQTAAAGSPLSLAQRSYCGASPISGGAIYGGPGDVVGGSIPATVPRFASQPPAMTVNTVGGSQWHRWHVRNCLL